jgi:hypothetical protein
LVAHCIEVEPVVELVVEVLAAEQVHCIAAVVVAEVDPNHLAAVDHPYRLELVRHLEHDRLAFALHH